MLSFTTVGREQPTKRPPDGRAQDFLEVARPFLAAKAEEQASRCSQCGVPFCQTHCPLGNHIPDWLRLAAEGRLEEAYELSSATSSMPEICGRICPQDRLCEGNCVIEPGFGGVTIGAVEKFITDTAWEQGWVRPLAPTANRSTQSVGIVGAGPAGLTAADALRAKGYDVHVYDRHDRAGGLLTYGIPGFKLEKDVVARRVERLAAGGVRFHLGVEVGRDLPFAELRACHGALLVATGVYRARELGGAAPSAGVIPALAYLTASNRKGFGDAVPAFDSGELDARGKRVVVIGGGDTAMDCVRTAVRQGAAGVTCLYRRDRANMPGSAREVAQAEEEGVRFEWLSAPTGFEDGGDGRVAAVRAQRMRLGPPDVAGRRRPVPELGPEARHEADLVVMALGFDPEDLPGSFAAPALLATRWGTLRVDGATGRTSMDGVFAAGDIVRGASLVVWAIRDGREAAKAMHRHLQAEAASGARAAAVAA